VTREFIGVFCRSLLHVSFIGQQNPALTCTFLGCFEHGSCDWRIYRSLLRVRFQRLFYRESRSCTPIHFFLGVLSMALASCDLRVYKSLILSSVIGVFYREARSCIHKQFFWSVLSMALAACDCRVY